MTGFTVRLDQTQPTPLSAVGGKGFNLARLARKGFTVPAGFIVTTKAWSEHTQQLVDTPVSAWREAVMATPLAAALRGELYRAWRSLRAQSVAVRSSATLEDGSNQSLAGHFESWLNLHEFADVELALKRCWASVRADGRPTGGAMAVVIQSLVTPRASGVMFTSVGEQGDDLIGVESVFGLGEALVSGLVTPDRYTIQGSSGDIVRREPSGSPLMLYPAEKSVGRLYGDVLEIDGTHHMVLREANFTGVVALKVPEDRAVKGSLSDEALRQLWEIAHRVRSVFNGEMDVEWAWDGTTVFVLQARAITTNVPWVLDQASTPASGLRGIAAAPGRASGTVVVLNPTEDGSRVQRGDVLVAYQTLPRWFFAMSRASAIITETGGLLSHAAIVARELGVPCVSAADNVTQTLQNGDLVTVDGDTGAIYAHETENPSQQVAQRSMWQETPSPPPGEWAVTHAALMRDPFGRSECPSISPPSLPITSQEIDSQRARQGTL